LVIDRCRVDGIELSVFPDFFCLSFSSRRVVLLAGIPEFYLQHSGMTLRGFLGRHWGAIALITYFVISELVGTKAEFNSGC
jgi:hypothetical protein